MLRVLRAFVVITAVPTLALSQEAHAQSLPAGIFTDSQATRGQAWYESACIACHPTRDMASPDFKTKWGGQSALALFTRISTTMPLGAPGTLSRRAYTDVVTYLMKLNGLPAGTTPLAADSLQLSQAVLAFTLPPTGSR